MFEPSAAKRARMAVDDMADVIRRQQQELAAKDEEILRLRHELEQKEQENERLMYRLSPTKSLPLEMLQRVISFVNVGDVVRNCILVSKKWEQAARSDLKTRKHLTIIESRSEHKCAWKGKQDEFFALKNQTAYKAAAKALMNLMPGVRYLCIDIHADYFEAWIMSLAPHLVELDTQSEDLPMKLGVVYHSLTSLTCTEASDQILASCPQLRSIRCTQDFTGTRIPQTMERMHVLIFPVYRIPGLDDAPLQEQVHAITRLVKLTHLKLDVTCDSRMQANRLMPLFRAFRHLLSFHLITNKKPDVPVAEVDAAVEVMVSQNPGLEEIGLKGFQITDQSMVSISRLRGLKSFELSKSGRRMTSHAVVLLFRGPSARLLEHVVIQKPGLTFTDAEREEIEAIASEEIHEFGGGIQMSNSFDRIIESFAM